MNTGRKIAIAMLLIAVLLGGAVVAGWRYFQPTFSASVSATFTEARNNTSFSTSSGSDLWFMPRRIVLVVLDQDPLTQQVANALAEQLRASPEVGDATVAGSLPIAADGAMVLALRTPTILRTPGTLERKLEATVLFAGGTQPIDSSSYYNDNLTPPITRMSITGDIDHRSTTKGVESDPYGKAAEGIADAIAEKLIAEFRKRHDKRPPDDLPASFVGDLATRPAPSFAFLARNQAELVAEQADVFVNRDQWWRFPLTGDPERTFEAIRSELEAAGWDARESHGSEEHLRAFKDDAILDLWIARRPPTYDADAWDDDLASPPAVFVHYRDRFGREQQQAAIADLLQQEDIPLQTLLDLREPMSKEQDRELLRRLIADDTNAYWRHMAIANLQHWPAGDKAASREALKHAADAAVREQRFDDRLGEVRRLAGRVGADELTGPITDEQLASWGLQSAADGEVKLTLAKGETGWVYHRVPEDLARGDEPIFLGSVHVGPNDEGKQALHIRLMQPGSISASSTTTGSPVSEGLWFAHHQTGANSLTMRADASGPPDGPYEVTVAIELPESETETKDEAASAP